MIIKNDIHTNIKINRLEDLNKLKPLMEGSNLKINKSQIARELNVDARTVEKYINGYKKPTTRNRLSKIDEFYPIIKELLSDESIQIFYYKRVLWQFLKDNYNLDCAQSSFRRYISSKLEGFSLSQWGLTLDNSEYYTQSLESNDQWLLLSKLCPKQCSVIYDHK